MFSYFNRAARLEDIFELGVVKDVQRLSFFPLLPSTEPSLLPSSQCKHFLFW